MLPAPCVQALRLGGRPLRAQQSPGTSPIFFDLESWAYVWPCRIVCLYAFYAVHSFARSHHPEVFQSKTCGDNQCRASANSSTSRRKMECGYAFAGNAITKSHNSPAAAAAWKPKRLTTA